MVYAELVDEVQDACSAVIMVFRGEKTGSSTIYKILMIDGYHEDYSQWEYNPLQMFYVEKNVN